MKFEGIARALSAGLAPILATPIAFLIPSKERHLNAGKLALLGLLVATFFLFASTYYFPGGAEQFTAYADAIANGSTMGAPLAVARDAGYPLLLILGGYSLWKTFIGITLIQAAFAVLMPLLIYWSIVRVSPAVAYYAGIASILSLAPVYFMKWIHHDQSYIFFTLLVVTLLANFLQTRRPAFLYFFTLAAVAASFTRPAGNFLFPALLIVSYFAARGRLVHYLACVIIFLAAAAAYQWHRYEIFDMANQPTTPSYTGQQTFYDLYINASEFGIRLSPDVGPALRQMTETLREKLQPDVAQSSYLQTGWFADYPPSFADEYILSYTPDELIERIYEAPNYEYYLILASASDSDQLVMQASWEIARAYPTYVAQYTLRNLSHMLFQPGYAHTRYNVNPFSPVGLNFMPAVSGIDHPLSIGSRERSELGDISRKELPGWVLSWFDAIKDSWQAHFGYFVLCTSILIVIAWALVAVRLLLLALPKGRLNRAFATPATNATVACTIAASMFLFYNALVTAAFVDPDYRYFHFTEPLRIVIAGCAIGLVVQMLGSLETRPARAKRVGHIATDSISQVRRSDLLAQVFGSRPTVFWLMLLLPAIASFGQWTAFMIERTW